MATWFTKFSTGQRVFIIMEKPRSPEAPHAKQPLIVVENEIEEVDVKSIRDDSKTYVSYGFKLPHSHLALFFRGEDDVFESREVAQAKLPEQQAKRDALCERAKLHRL